MLVGLFPGRKGRKEIEHVAPDASSGVAREARNDDVGSKTNVGRTTLQARSLCSRGGRGVRPYTSRLESRGAGVGVSGVER